MNLQEQVAAAMANNVCNKTVNNIQELAMVNKQLKNVQELLLQLNLDENKYQQPEMNESSSQNMTKEDMDPAEMLIVLNKMKNQLQNRENRWNYKQIKQINNQIGPINNDRLLLRMMQQQQEQLQFLSRLLQQVKMVLVLFKIEISAEKFILKRN